MSAVPRVLIATGNVKKLGEMAEIMADPRWEIVSLADYPNVDAEVEETGLTYAENATLKAEAACQATGLAAIADDAGFEVDALNGEPGLRSRRFMGEDTPFDRKMQHILDLLADVPYDRRGCRFRAAVAIAVPGRPTVICDGVCEGVVAREMRGSYGFGYDPIFYVPSLGLHMAELPPEAKHRISHRGIALACAKRRLAELLDPT
ncbi:MAG: RdgB/HAM1 family non-canonical purine NTP pyrophosphatase [Armatimonadetes bacterium]|nr:RdgB/HAM1 family non-canonical purine NTP pyrophosphatase [Armatimonadota bacterium]